MVTLLLVASVLFVYMRYTFKKVDANDYKHNFDLNSKEPNGLYVFKKLLEEKYQKTNVEVKKFILGLNSIDTNTVYLFINNSFSNFDSINAEITRFVRRGGQAIIISSHIYKIYTEEELKQAQEEENENISEEEEYADTMAIDEVYDEDSTATNMQDDKAVNDEQSDDYQEAPEAMEEYNEWDKYNSKIGFVKVSDSIFLFKDVKTQYFVYSKFKEKDTLRTDFPEITFEAESLIKSLSGVIISNKYNIGKGTLILHNAPDFFYNLSTLNEAYLAHFNLIMNEVNGKKLLINQEILKKNNWLGDKSPIRELLANKSLSTAYYLLLFFGLSYLLLNGKRLQRPIPLIKKVKNTSLEYVQTLSRLYQLDNQNHKLIEKMKDNFISDMKRKYYLDYYDEHFNTILSKKTNLSESVIEELKKGFHQAEITNYADDQDLNNIYLLIEKFYNKENE